MCSLSYDNCIILYKLAFALILYIQYEHCRFDIEDKYKRKGQKQLSGKKVFHSI